MTTAPSRRVLHVLKAYRPAFTGEGIFLERSSAVMQEIAGGVAHDLLVTHTPRPAAPATTGFCSTLQRVTYLADRPVGTLRREALLAWWFIRHLHRYDTVHFRTHSDWYFLASLLTKLTGRRLVLSATLDDSLPVLIGHYRPSLRPLAARGFGMFDAFIGISAKLHDQNLATAADPARCHLIPCGVTIPPAIPGARAALRASLGIADDALVLLFVGGLCARKDPLFLIEALPAILARHPGTRLLLVGPPLEPAYVAALHARVAALGLAGAVMFLGELLDPHPYFAAADLLVFASRLEGFGTVVPEGMAHGLPVIARRLPGVNDAFILEGETGFLFEDEAGYCRAVLRMAADAAERRCIGATGKAFAIRAFGMRLAAARYLGVYGMAAEISLPPDAATETSLAASASILDPRFHTPATPARDATPLLITMVDAEEAFDWSRPFSRDARDVTAMRSQNLAHRVFERHGVVPVYLADYPVATQDAGRGPLRELHEGGACEVGAQLHPWVTPPFTEALGEANSFAGNLPATLELEKAQRLTDALQRAFGIAPGIWRTGRFGAGLRTGDVLKRLGYVADSSLSPCWPVMGRGGKAADWTSAPAPYWVDRERSLMEIPVSAALVGSLGAGLRQRLAPLLLRSRPDRLHLSGIAARLRLLERIRLTPEGNTIDEAKRLVRAMHAAGHRVFVLTYHSPSLEPGNTPYVRTAAQRERFLAWLDEFYAFFREEIGGRPASWREVRFGPGAAVAAAPVLEAAR